MAEACPQGDLPEDIYVPYVLSPRVSNEKLTAWRAALSTSFDEAQKKAFIADPEVLWNWILEHVSSNDSREYSTLIAAPDKIMKVGYGSYLSKKVLFVAVCRTLGVPARLNPETKAIQFYRDGAFHNVEKANKAKTLPFTVVSGDDTKWVYFQNWSLGILHDGIYNTLDLSEREWADGKVLLDLAPGAYRLITAKRMPNGSLFTKEYRFTVGEGHANNLTIRLRDTKISDMLENMDILPFSLKDKDGGKIEAEKLTAGKANILFWLEEGKEPTEHILNELIEHHVRYNALDAQLVFIIRSDEAKKITPWQKRLNCCQTLPSATMTSVKTFLPLQEECMLIRINSHLSLLPNQASTVSLQPAVITLVWATCSSRFFLNNSCFSGGTAYTVPPVILCLFDMIEYVIIIL